jgi:hypothetical protein
LKGQKPAIADGERSIDSKCEERLERKMQEILNRLNLPLRVNWVPDKTRQVHGEIKRHTIFVYDEREYDAIVTFEHEVCEHKFKEATRLYRSMVNSLLDVLEKEVYCRKESFFDFLPILQEAMKSLKDQEALNLR